MVDSAAMLEDPSSSHRIYVADSIGCLQVAQCPSLSSIPEKYAGPSIKTVVLPGFKSHSDHYVQRMAYGVLSGNTCVVALARKNATIDVVHLTNQAPPSASSSSINTPSDVKARILCTVREEHMKAGIQRFIGLAVGTHGIYSITSSGVFRFTPIAIVDSEAELGKPTTLNSLPSPLQHASFYPASDPSHFCYGGEDIPLSLWHIPTAIAEPSSATDASNAGDESFESVKTGDDLAGLNSKQRKRKRQLESRAKARELLWGEVWRAKNLPNDNLSLPRRANITCTSIIHLSSTTADDVAAASSVSMEDGPAHVGKQTAIAVGTKDGLVRIFEPGSGVRKHVQEIRVVPSGQGAVKTLCASLSPLEPKLGGTLYVGDTGSKVYSVDWKNGSVLFGYKSSGQVGSALSLAILPSAVRSGSSKGREGLVSVSSDSLVRMLTTVPSAKAVAKQGSSPEKGEVVWGKMLTTSSSSSIMAVPTAVVWDGVVPRASATNRTGGHEAASDADNDYDSNGDGDDEDDEEDEVWAGMEEVGAQAGSRKSHKNGARQDQDSDDDEDDDQDLAHNASNRPTARNGTSKKVRK
ncbi:hypothetical protein BCV70DRAFT_198478 [Testicularia cyperi]|uniref:Ribosome biogenesis protein NSA1 n=1 Tax=Testicularia cyperi TaxID=1882483 RepID=A0A317XXX1_9BASI|nr:hypothetical protein BCV70DRAFT_198478 [Testicularia cyperi]